MVNISKEIAAKKQEIPPAWTQEAYLPPCSKYALWWGGGNYTGWEVPTFPLLHLVEGRYPPFRQLEGRYPPSAGR